MATHHLKNKLLTRKLGSSVSDRELPSHIAFLQSKIVPSSRPHEDIRDNFAGQERRSFVHTRSVS